MKRLIRFKREKKNNNLVCHTLKDSILTWSMPRSYLIMSGVVPLCLTVMIAKWINLCTFNQLTWRYKNLIPNTSMINNRYAFSASSFFCLTQVLVTLFHVYSLHWSGYTPFVCPPSISKYSFSLLALVFFLDIVFKVCPGTNTSFRSLFYCTVLTQCTWTSLS